MPSQLVSPSQLGFVIQAGQLTTDGTDVTFSPYNGNYIFIGTRPILIPASGASFDFSEPLIEGGALANNTTYYVYAQDSSNQVVILPSATAPTLNTANGLWERTGDSTSALVGSITTGIGNFQDAISFFNVPNSYLLNRANHTGTQDASTIGSGILDIARVPIAALSRLYTVADETARYALTTAQVQNGDTVLQVSPNNAMYYVVDDSNLGNASGYQIYTATADWATITNKPAILVDLAAIAGAGTGDVIQYNGANWVRQTTSQLKTSLDLTAGDTATGVTASLVTSSGVATINLSSTTSLYLLTLTENLTSWVFNNLPAAGRYKDIEIQVTQDAAVAYTAASPATAGTAGGAWNASPALSSVEVLSVRIFSDGSRQLFPSGLLL